MLGNGPLRRIGLAALAVVAASAVGAISGVGSAVVGTPGAAQASPVNGYISRSEIIERAKYWADAGYTYLNSSSPSSWVPGIDYGVAGALTYRRDCSGLVSNAWHLTNGGGGFDTGTFSTWAGKTDLAGVDAMLPGDAMVRTGHMELFAGWKNTANHSLGGYVYSFNNTGETVENPYALSNFGTSGERSYSALSGFSNYIRLKTVLDDDGMHDLASGDFTRNGRDDLVAANWSAGELWAYPNNGSVGLNSPTRIGSSGWNGMHDLVVGDFSGDDWPDVVAAEFSTGKLWLYPGTYSAGVMALSGRIQIGSGGWNHMHDLVIADYNHDGRPDLVAGDYIDGTLWVYPNTSSFGVVTLGARIKIGSSGWNSMRDLSAGDWNMDGAQDIMAVNAATGVLTVYPSLTSTIGLQSPTAISSGWNADHDVIRIWSFNNHSYDDVIMADRTTGKLYMFPNLGGPLGSTLLGSAIVIGSSGW